MEHTQIVINIRGDQADICDEINSLLEFSNLDKYGLPKLRALEIQQISPVNATNVFVLLKCSKAKK